ncbi:MAG: hypothetical protein RIR08_822 [Pseudomonadota bacterium]
MAKAPMRVAVTGAAGQIGYFVLPMAICWAKINPLSCSLSIASGYERAQRSNDRIQGY